MLYAFVDWTYHYMWCLWQTNKKGQCPRMNRNFAPLHLVPNKSRASLAPDRQLGIFSSSMVILILYISLLKQKTFWYLDVDLLSFSLFGCFCTFQKTIIMASWVDNLPNTFSEFFFFKNYILLLKMHPISSNYLF